MRARLLDIVADTMVWVPVLCAASGFGLLLSAVFDH